MATPNPAAIASCPSARWLVPLIRFCMKRSYARFSTSRTSSIVRYSFSRVARSGLESPAAREACAWLMDFLDCLTSVSVGDGKLSRGKQRNDFAALVGHHDFFLDSRSRPAVAGGAKGLERESRKKSWGPTRAAKSLRCFPRLSFPSPTLTDVRQSRESMSHAQASRAAG